MPRRPQNSPGPSTPESDDPGVFSMLDTSGTIHRPLVILGGPKQLREGSLASDSNDDDKLPHTDSAEIQSHAEDCQTGKPGDSESPSAESLSSVSSLELGSSQLTVPSVSSLSRSHPSLRDLEQAGTALGPGLDSAAGFNTPFRAPLVVDGLINMAPQEIPFVVPAVSDPPYFHAHGVANPAVNTNATATVSSVELLNDDDGPMPPPAWAHESRREVIFQPGSLVPEMWYPAWTPAERKAKYIMRRSRLLRQPHATWRSKAGDDVEAECDNRLVKGLDPIMDPWLYSFGLRYCTADYQVVPTQQEEDRSPESPKDTEPSSDLDDENQKKLLAMEFIPWRGSLTSRVEEITEYAGYTEDFPIPSTENVLLRSVDHDTFRTKEIKLAIWPEAFPTSPVRCAVFLINDMTASVRKTVHQDVGYEIPWEDELLDETVPPERQFLELHFASVPEPLEYVRLDSHPRVTVTDAMDLKFPATERGIVGKFGPDSPLKLNVRVSRKSPHLIPVVSDDDQQSFEGAATKLMDELAKGNKESQETDKDGVASRETNAIPLLEPHACIQLNGNVTTIEFHEPIPAKAILLKFWGEKRYFGEKILRTVEVHGAQGRRVFHSDVKSR